MMEPYAKRSEQGSIEFIYVGKWGYV